MDFSKDRILEILKTKGIDVRQLASNPALFERSCSLVYRALPIPWRWVVGHKRIRSILNALREGINRESIKPASGKEGQKLSAAAGAKLIDGVVNNPGSLTTGPAQSKDLKMDAPEEIEQRKKQAEQKKIYQKARDVLLAFGSYERTETGEESARSEREFVGEKIVIKSNEICHEASVDKVMFDDHLDVWGKHHHDTPVFRATFYFREFYKEETKTSEYVAVQGYIPGAWESDLEQLYARALEDRQKKQEEIRKRALVDEKKAFGLADGETKAEHGRILTGYIVPVAPSPPLSPKREEIPMTETQWISCASCNEQIDLPAKFCPMCGKPLSEAQEKSAAQQHLTAALKWAVAENSDDAAMAARRALELGLPGKDEVLARTVLGSALLTSIDQNMLESGSEQLMEGISEMEKAVSLDVQGKYGFFDDPLQKAGWMPKLEIAYSLRGNWIRENQGVDQAITYLKDRLKLFEHWSGNYFVLLNFVIGNFCQEKGDYTGAKTYWLCSLDATPFSEDGDHERDAKQKARNNLKILESELAFTERKGLVNSVSAKEKGGVMKSKQQEFERQLKVAWSCLKDVEKRINEIREARDAADRETKEGTFRGTIAMSALKGRLEREFQESLNMAWNAATKASEIDADGSVEIDGLDITPAIVFGGVCCSRGDLRFALEKWDEAVGFYKEAVRYATENPGYYYNLAAAYTNKHDPAAAINTFEKVIELDPTGEYGIEAAKALERLKTGTLGNKVFTGSWKVVAVLGGMTLVSLFMIKDVPGAGFVNLIFWGGILALYWWRKFK